MKCEELEQCDQRCSYYAASAMYGMACLWRDQHIATCPKCKGANAKGEDDE